MQIYVKKSQSAPPQTMTFPKPPKNMQNKAMILGCKTLYCNPKTNNEFSYFLKEGYLAC